MRKRVAPGGRRGPANRWLRSAGRRRRRMIAAIAVPLGAVLVFLAARIAVEGGLLRVREITFRGLVNARAEVLAAESGLTRPRSLLDDLESVEARLRRDPLVRAARVRRELPSRLVVDVEERRPVAYWAGPELRPVDADGRLLPLDPARFGWDLPVLMVSARDGAAASAIQEGRIVDGDGRALLRLVIGIRDRVPEVARRISVAELASDGRVRLHLMDEGGEVRLRLETPIEKVALVPEVVRDLELRHMRFQSLDLSFADQIVVRPIPLPAPAEAGPATEAVGDRPSPAAIPLEPAPGELLAPAAPGEPFTTTGAGAT